MDGNRFLNTGPFGPEWKHQHADGKTYVHPGDEDCTEGVSAVPTYPKPEPVADRNVIDHPSHYLNHPSGVECITITEHMGFNLGNVVKYVWRADLKGDAVEDLKKARWYITREIERLESKP